MKFELGMPHLNYNGLDPVWLAKTLTEIHWCSLKDISSLNELNQRLYASIIAFRADFDKGQDQYKEFAQAEINSKVYKFSNQIYRSTFEISCETNIAKATLDSIFVKKDLTSNTLVRDTPVHCNKEFETVNSINLEEHKELKKKYAVIENVNEYKELVFSPEAYFNGVKILYFANYINLVYLSEYLTFNKILDPIKKIEIFFFKNISPGDKVYGLTKQFDNVYETVLISDSKIMSYCRFTR
jgi:probable biosynthetic protein (TIGR04098 family)